MLPSFVPDLTSLPGPLVSNHVVEICLDPPDGLPVVEVDLLVGEGPDVAVEQGLALVDGLDVLLVVVGVVLRGLVLPGGDRRLTAGN